MSNLPASNMRFGVLIVREFPEYTDTNLPALIEELTRLGCSPHNIVLRDMPTMHDLLMGTEFFAEYTDVDGVIILAPNNRVMGEQPQKETVVISERTFILSMKTNCCRGAS